MKKVLVCNNCNTENPFYMRNCNKCNSFLRSKIANIDLWDTFWKLLESPIKTAELIIQSEHKNFVVSILLLASIKIGFLFLVIFNALFFINNEIENSFRFIALSGFYFILLLIIISFLITALNNFLGLENRFKDNLALYSYSFLPIVLTLIVLTPIQIAIYGTYWFTFHPSPLLFKPFTTYVLILIEGLFFLWSFLLIITSTYSQSKNLFYSIVIGISMIITLSFGIYYILMFSYS